MNKPRPPQSLKEEIEEILLEHFLDEGDHTPEQRRCSECINSILSAIELRLPETREDFWVNKNLVTVEQATKKGIVYGHNKLLEDIKQLLK